MKFKCSILLILAAGVLLLSGCGKVSPPAPKPEDTYRPPSALMAQGDGLDLYYTTGSDGSGTTISVPTPAEAVIIKVVMNGNFGVNEITLNADMDLRQQQTILKDLLNEAREKIQRQLAQKMVNTRISL